MTDTHEQHLDTLFKRMVRKAVLAFSARNRRKKVADVLAFVNEIQARDVLLVGAMGEENAGIDDKALDGYVEKQLADHCTIKMGINVVPAVTPYPFQIADARSMPFVDDYADFALANAIIEHVGQEADQRQMVNEMTRVARNWIITTPNIGSQLKRTLQLCSSIGRRRGGGSTRGSSRDFCRSASFEHCFLRERKSAVRRGRLPSRPAIRDD